MKILSRIEVVFFCLMVDFDFTDLFVFTDYLSTGGLLTE